MFVVHQICNEKWWMTLLNKVGQVRLGYFYYFISVSSQNPGVLNVDSMKGSTENKYVFINFVFLGCEIPQYYPYLPDFSILDHDLVSFPEGRIFTFIYFGKLQ